MTTYKDKFALLEPFYTDIFTCIRKDLRDEHLRTDRGFFKRNFSGKQLNKLTTSDFLEVYPQFIEKGFESISEFIANRWLLRHLDIYNFFEARLKEQNENIEEIVELDTSVARKLLDDALQEFSPQNIYIFTVLNSVAIPQDMLQELRSHATVAYSPA